MRDLEGLKCAIYNRCSTIELSQQKALEIQVSESAQIVRQLGGLLVEQYVEAESGTTTRFRIKYQRMIQDMTNGLFDCIVIKSQDRLMRNAGDWHIFINKLMEYNLKLYIYIERQFYTPNDAFLAGVKALMAEQYSRDLSIKINNANRGRQETGRSLIITNRLYGYDKEGQNYRINEEEAGYVRKIFNLAIQGYGSRIISNKMYQEGMRSLAGTQVSDSQIRRIIRNQTYYGTIVMNRFHYDFETHRTMKVPEENWIYHKNRIVPIVSEVVWKKANEAMSNRRYIKGNNVKSRQYNMLSGKIICSECGASYYRCSHRLKDGTNKIQWCCKNYVIAGKAKYMIDGKTKQELGYSKIGNGSRVCTGCDNGHLNQDILMELLEKLCTKRYGIRNDNPQELIEDTIIILREVFCNHSLIQGKERICNRKEKIENKKNILMEKLMNQVITDEEFKRWNNKLNADIDECNQQADMILNQINSQTDFEDRLSYIKQEMEKQNIITKAMTIEMINSIATIVKYPSGKLEVMFHKQKMNTGRNVQIKENLEENAKGRYDVETIIYQHIGEKQKLTNRNRERVYQVIKKDPKATIEEMAESIGISVTNFHRHIKSLKEQGRIRRVGGCKNGYWEILD